MCPYTKVQLEKILLDETVTREDLAGILESAVREDVQVAVNDFYVSNDYPVIRDEDVAYDSYRDIN